MRRPRVPGIVIALALLVAIGVLLYPFLTNPTSVTHAFDRAGFFAPVLFILLVMLAPTPGAIVGASGGAYFGIWVGAFLLFVGNFLGVLITFLLVRRYGRPAAERFVRNDKLRAYEKFVQHHPFLQWFVYALPIFPLELMTFVIALSGRETKKFVITILTALPLYALFVTWIGYELSAQYQKLFGYASIVILIIIVYAILHIFYAWKQKEIHATGRMWRRAMDRSVGDATRHVSRHVSHVHQEMRKLTGAKKKPVGHKRNRKRNV